ncbi:MAG: hypothetical protein JKY61_09840 [Planctomycetes bacterium]|nr:hypothetical protein [Planctomycetota bacterium]
MGSLVTAAGQFLPIVHFVVGVLTISVVGMVSPSNSMEDMQAGVFVFPLFWEGLAGSMIVGLLMAFTAILLGLFFHMIWPASGQKRDRLASSRQSNFSGKAASGPEPGPQLGP